MQALKPENWSSVHLPELEPTGREGGESRVTTGCHTRGLDWREQGLWNCPEIQKSRVYVSANISQPESSARAESGPGLCPITDTLQHYHRGTFTQDWDRPVPDKNWGGHITECTVDNLDHGSGLIDSADELSSSRQSPVSSEKLFSLWLEGKQSPLSHLETARIRCTPGIEQARVCHLFSVKNGWLPLRKKGIRVHLPNLNSLLYQRQIEVCINSITHKHNKCKEEEEKVKDGKIDNNWSLSMSCRNRTFPSSLSTPNINETFNKVDIPAWLHRDGPPWSVWRGREVGMEGGTPTPWGQNRSGASLRWAPTLQRATSVPDVLVGETKAGFSSITITSRKLSSTQIHRSHESLHTYPQPQPGRTARALTEISALSSDHNMSSKSALEIPRASILKVTEDRCGSSVFDRVMVRGADRRIAGLPDYRYNYTEGDRSQDTGRSSGSLPPAHSFRSCLHVDLPLMSSSSHLFLTKSLSISLGQAEDRSSRAHRSTLSLYVGRASHHRPPKTNRKADCRISRFEQERAQKLDNQEADLGHSGGHPLQPWGCEVPEATCSDGANRQSTDSDTQRSTPELLSFRGPGLSYTGASWQNGNADEKLYPPFSNFRHRHPTCNVNPGDFRTRGRQPQSEQREERKERLGGSGKTPHVNNNPNAHIKFARCSCRMDDISARPSRTLSPREALEQFRPDFISRSQGRLRRLQQRARRRRALQDPNPDMVHGLGGDMARHRGDNYTKPDPLSDNLFRPKERSISDQEMQLRSRRIYNKLPEVTKKKEEEKRRAVSQTNRLRAELFKKRLLNQLLQR